MVKNLSETHYLLFFFFFKGREKVAAMLFTERERIKMNRIEKIKNT